MKTPFEPSRLLDRGGEPTVRELLSRLVFDPTDGTIRLNGDRVVMQRAAVGVELRRELIGQLGHDEARIFLMRLGFLSGQADARFVRTSWPSLDIGDAFTAGTRLHTFSGVVRVETVYNDFDFRRKRFAGEFLWHDSVEAAEFRRLRRKSTEPVCWTQLGYASGYATEFFETLIVYKEVACSAQEHPHCRVVGKPADGWGARDPEVMLFRERIVPPREDGSAMPSRKVALRNVEGAMTELDRLIVAPVREELDKLAPMPMPVMITGASGTGRFRAAQYLHRASGMPESDARHVFAAQVDLDFCAEIARRGKAGRRGVAAETIVIDAAEKIRIEIQPHLARSIEAGMAMGGPRILALVGHDPVADVADHPPLSAELWYTLSALTLRMPPLAERKGEIAAIAKALVPLLAARMGLHPPLLDASAADAIERADWPGNFRQMRSVLCAVLVARQGGQSISGGDIEAQLFRFRAVPQHADRGAQGGLGPLVDRMLGKGGFSLSEFERSTYEAAVNRTGGNLSAAARLLGLTRAQLAYRIGVRDGP
jgi:Activator of aromatic catabolism/V4R domain/Bacterial regulatory protein, Fis family/Sigma-54 interaction domain